MKYLKILGLAAVAAMALMAFAGAGTASAAGVLCSTATTPCTSKWAVGTTLEFSLKTGTSAKLTTTDTATLATCTSSTLTGTLTENPNATTKNATGSVAKAGLTWGGCLVTTTTLEGGTLEVEAGSAGAGTVRAKGFQITINTGAFGSCTYTAGTGTHLGTLSEGSAGTATLSINAVVSKLAGVLCPPSARWIAEYTLTKPTNTTLYVSAS